VWCSPGDAKLLRLEDGQLTVEAALLEDPSTQLQHAVGRYPISVFDQAGGVGALAVLASDGGRILEAVRQGVRVSDLAA
jgi:hypothetical protein